MECSRQFGINMNLFVYTTMHFRSKLPQQLCVPSHTHREWVWSYCTGKHNQHGSVAQLQWGTYLVVLFFSVCVVNLLNYARLGALQFWLGYIYKCKQACGNPLCYCFHKDETTTNLPQSRRARPYGCFCLCAGLATGTKCYQFLNYINQEQLCFKSYTMRDGQCTTAGGSCSISI